MPELISQTKKTFFQCRISSGTKPLHSSKGSRKAAAMQTRSPAVGKAPNSLAPKRMNKKEEPQMAASRTNSMSQGLAGAVEFKMGSMSVVRVARRGLSRHPLVEAVPSFGASHRRNP